MRLHLANRKVFWPVESSMPFEEIKHDMWFWDQSSIGAANAIERLWLKIEQEWTPPVTPPWGVQPTCEVGVRSGFANLPPIGADKLQVAGSGILYSRFRSWPSPLCGPHPPRPFMWFYEPSIYDFDLYSHEYIAPLYAYNTRLDEPFSLPPLFPSLPPLPPGFIYSFISTW